MAYKTSGYQAAPRAFGKRESMAAIISAHLTLGREPVVACEDQGAIIQWLAQRFPNRLYSLVGDWGVQVHLRNRKGR